MLYHGEAGIYQVLYCNAVQRKNAVTAYFPSKQLLHFIFAEKCKCYLVQWGFYLFRC